MPLTLAAELTWVDGEARPGLAVSLGSDGSIEAVGPLSAVAAEHALVRLPRRLLMPGLVNAHSHAFQRLLRGRTEWRAAGRDDFWTWRTRMYEVAGRLEPDEIEAVSAFAFLEMVRTGITTVGEFHYLHRDPAGQAYSDPCELSRRVIAAAERVGLRITLLRTAYARGGPAQALEGPQRRFGLESVERFVAETEQLGASLREHSRVAIGIAPHSVRALSPGQLAELAVAAARRSWPVHMHVAEQEREVEQCLAETRRRPLELAADQGLLSERFCAVHAIRVAPTEMTLLGRAKATVCACPTTERNLGDGVVPAAALRSAGVELALGTDSQVQIDLWEEARSLEMNLRLVEGRRVVMDSSSGASSSDGSMALATVLMSAATDAGARALGWSSPAIRVGGLGDLVTIDLDDPSVAGREDDVLSQLVFGGQSRAVRDVVVGGKFIVRDGHHADERAILAGYQAVAKRLA